MTDARARERGPMTDAEFKVTRERLGLTTRWLADHLAVAERTVHRWEAGQQAVPGGVQDELDRLAAIAGAAVEQLEAELEQMPDPHVVTYRTDDDYRAVEPDTDWPASWHRALAARVAERRPDAAVVYRIP
jgi:DNA-binding transcriptional regulator YiaG